MAVTGLVLAGGKSSRMKTNKADLLLGNKTLQQHSVELLKSIGLSDVVISRNTGGENTNYLTDIYPHQGPLGGIYSALKYTSNDLLVTAVDMPLVNKALLVNLLNFYKSHDYSTHHCSPNIVHYCDFPLPHYIKNNRHTLQYLSSVLTITNSNRSIKQFIKKCGGVALQSKQQQLLSNINTPAQYTALCALHDSKPLKQEATIYD